MDGYTVGFPTDANFRRIFHYEAFQHILLAKQLSNLVIVEAINTWKEYAKDMLRPCLGNCAYVSLGLQ